MKPLVLLVEVKERSLLACALIQGSNSAHGGANVGCFICVTVSKDSAVVGPVSYSAAPQCLCNF